MISRLIRMFGIAGSSHAQQKIEKVKVKIEKCKMKRREVRGNGKDSRLCLKTRKLVAQRLELYSLPRGFSGERGRVRGLLRQSLEVPGETHLASQIGNAGSVPWMITRSKQPTVAVIFSE